MAYTYITGSGTQADPYVISDKDGWNEFCNDVNTGNSMVGQFVELAADIRYNDSDANKNGYARRYYTEQTPTIGISHNLQRVNIYTHSFRGDFNGNNHTIYGINVAENDSVMSISNGAHIHHVRFEKIISTEEKKFMNVASYGSYSVYDRIPFHSCISVNCKRYITSDVSTHRKENGQYVVLNDIVCSATVNFVTVNTHAFVTLKNILYSCDSISEGCLPQDAFITDGDIIPYYLVEVTGMNDHGGLGNIELNINTTDISDWSAIPFLTSLKTAIGASYIIKNNEIYAGNNSQNSVKPVISISNCTAYNAFLINPDLVRPDALSSADLSSGEVKPTFTYFQYLIRDSVSYFPDSEFFNHKLSTYIEIQPSYLYDFNIHRLNYSFYNHMSERTLSTDYDDEIYCFGGDNDLSDSTQPLMTSNTLFVSGDCSDENIWRIKDLSFPDSLKKPAILVSDMQNIYINSLREILTDEGGLLYSTIDTIPQFINSTRMLFSSDLKCYVPAPFVNDYVYWNIKSTPDNYRIISHYLENLTYVTFTYEKVFWCLGNIGLIRKGTDVNLAIGCIDGYKIPYLSLNLRGDGRNFTYIFDSNECHSKTYSNVTSSWLIEFNVKFEHSMSGEGTENSPYIIHDANDLQAFLTIIHYLGFESDLINAKKYFKDTYFKLDADIQLQDSNTINSLNTPTSGIYFSCTTEETDFSYSNPARDDYYGCFCGILDGNNHSIIGLYDQYFHMSEYAVIKNLYFVVCNIVFFMNNENIKYDINYRSLNPPTIIDSYISGYIDFSIFMGHIRRCVIHNLKYCMGGYNMVATDHYPYNIVDEYMEYVQDGYSGYYKYPFTFVQPDVEFSDCLFMENASNILPTSIFGRITYDNDNITGDIAIGKCINTPCYNMFNNVYIGTYENAIFSPYHIYCEDRYNEVYEDYDASDEILIIKENRKEVADIYKNKYKSLYIKSSSLLRHGRINNCGSIINDDDWNTESSFRTLDFVNTWKMTNIGPVPKKLNIVTHSIAVSCSNVYIGYYDLRKIDPINTSTSYTDDDIHFISSTPEHLTFLKWDDTDSTNASRSFDYSSDSLWITYSMRTNEEYSGGDGTKENPYQISTVDDMYDFLSFHIDDSDDASFGIMPYMYYILTTDLEMNDVSDYDIVNPEPYEDYTPVRRLFYGEFDGMNHHISGLNPQMLEFPSDDEDDAWDNIPFTNIGDWVGISSFILHFSGKLKNLIIDKVYIPKTENALICGGIVCYAYAGNNPDVTEITNCKFMGVIDNCYQIGLCGGLFAVTADSLGYSNFLTMLYTGDSSLIPFEQENSYWYSLVYETFFMNIDTQKIVIDNSNTVGSIRMSDVIDNNTIFNSYLIQKTNEYIPSEISTSIKSWYVFKLTSGFFNYCYEQGLPVYIQNSVNNMDITGIISSALCTRMNIHKNLPVFIEKSYNTGNITATTLISTLSTEHPTVFTASGIMMSFTSSYINIKNCYNNGEISAYNASGIHNHADNSELYSIYMYYESSGGWSQVVFNSMPNIFYMPYPIENCYNYNDITPMFNSEHTYAIGEPFYTGIYAWEEYLCNPINCYSLENTTTDDTNRAVIYLDSDEFKVKSNFEAWDFNNTWVSPTPKNRPLLNENLEGDNLYRLKLSVNNKGFGTATGEGVYEENTIVELLAVPFTSYKFEGWSDGNKKNPRNYVVDHNEYIQAIFRFDGYSIRLLDYEGLKRFRDNMKNYIREENDKKVDIVMAGDSDTPVYFNSAGVPTPCTSLDLNTSGNAGSATKLETPRNINGVEFDGTTDIMIRPINIGLGNVDNTSDMDKPVSTATQNALMVLETDIIDKVSYDNITYRMIDDIFD